MSRTDQHRPFWTRLSDKSLAVEEHNHTKGECDLISVEDWIHLVATDSEKANNMNCSWDMSASDRHKNKSCGCTLCTQQEWRKRESRKVRRQGKNETRKLSRAILKSEEE